MITFENVKRRAELDAKTHGYFLTPEPEFLQNLLEGLKENEERYGYPSCPCRLASGNFDWDRDIICPCDYRDPDIEEFGMCYCALYVRKDIVDGSKSIEPIPERRPPSKIDRALGTASEKKVVPEAPGAAKDTNRKFYYCKVCGYVTFREEPPHVCPICRAKREFFEEIIIDKKIQVR